MKNKNTAELRKLARDLKASAVKVSKSVANCPKIGRVQKSRCGCHSDLPNDTKWEKIRYGVFDMMKKDHGDNRALAAAIVQMKYNKKFGIV